MHGWRVKTPHTVGKHGCLLKARQPARAGSAAPMAAVKAPNGISAWAVPHRSSSSFGVSGDLHADHSVGIDHRLALLDLVDHLHAGEDFPDHGIFAVEEGAVGIHDEELRIRRVWIARARHPDGAALE